MGLFQAFQTAASGLTAERLRMDVIANNLANVNTTRTPQGGPFRRMLTVLMPRGGAQGTSPLGQTLRPMADNLDAFIGTGVRVVAIVPDGDPPKMVYDPGHPDANAQGYVAMPNVNVVSEMVDMITASRAYEANVTVFNAVKSMANKALEIGRG